MNFPWFKRIGIFYIPLTLMGWLLFAAGIAYAVYLFIDLNSRLHSVSGIVINFVFNLFILGVIYTLMAYLINKASK